MKQVINNVNVVEKPKTQRQFGIDNLVNCCFSALIVLAVSTSGELPQAFHKLILFYGIFSALTLADISRKLSSKE